MHLKHLSDIMRTMTRRSHNRAWSVLSLALALMLVLAAPGQAVVACLGDTRLAAVSAASQQPLVASASDGRCAPEPSEPPVGSRACCCTPGAASSTSTAPAQPGATDSSSCGCVSEAPPAVPAPLSFAPRSAGPLDLTALLAPLAASVPVPPTTEGSPRTVALAVVGAPRGTPPWRVPARAPPALPFV